MWSAITKTKMPDPSPDLLTKPIPQAVAQLAAPAAWGMLFVTIFNIVDMYYAGQLSTEAQAGISLGNQAFAALSAFGFGLAAAMGALTGNAIGRKDADEARIIAAQGLTHGALTGPLLILIGASLGPWVMRLISEDDGYRHAAIAYFRVMMFALPFFLMAYGCNGVLQAQGDGKSMKRAMMAAALANIVLNPLCIYGLPGLWGGLGFSGLAASSVICWAGVCAFMMTRALRSTALRGATLRMARPNWPRLAKISGQSVPTTSSFAVLFLSGFIVQFALKGFGESAVAGYGVALRIEQILFLPLQGMSIALLPIAAQAYGAGNLQRMRVAFLFCCKTGSLIAISATFLLWTFGRPVLGLFTQQADVIDVGLSYLRIDGLVLPFYMMIFAINSMFQAFQKPGWPFWIGLYRRGFGLALFIWVFIGPLAMGVSGIWFAHVVAVVSGWTLSMVLLFRVMGAATPDFRPEPAAP